jgi:hypothetical protein
MKEKKMNMRRAMIAAGALSLCAGLAFGQEQPRPQDYDFRIRPAALTVAPGATFEIETTVAPRTDGGQGWSYGVKHDRAVLEIVDVTFDGTDGAGIFSGGFQNTEISNSEDAPPVKLGWTQGVVLSFTQAIFVPQVEGFSMGKATYKANDGACGGGEVDVVTMAEYTDQLSATPGGPLVDVNFTVNGLGVVPGVLAPVAVTVACASAPISLDLRMASGGSLPADRQATLAVDIQVTNSTGDGGSVGAQAWSYAIRFDGSLLAVADFGIGSDAAAVKGGNGPDFQVHDPLDENEDGTVDAVIAGAVVDLSKAQDAVLPLPDGTAVDIGRLVLRSAVAIPEGGNPQTTSLRFETIEGNKKVSTIENLFTIDAQSVEPDISEAHSVTLTPGGVVAPGKFIRGDANDDRRVDIADGIWIILFLFYGGERKPCMAAADANDDGRRDIADALYIINYQLQPDAALRGGPLAPPPPAPFPGCNTDPDVPAADCPQGSTRCGT